TLAVTKEVQNFRDASDQLKTTWRDIVKENQASIFNAMSAGIRGVTSAMSQLKPFLSEVSMLVEANARKFEDWVKHSETTKKAFEALNSIGGAIFGDLLNAAGRFGDGLINIFTQLMPLFKFVSQGLQNMSIAFQNWANSVAGQNAIKAFIDYTTTNLPKIGQIFGNVFAGIGNLMIAFAQNSSNIFDWLVKLTSQFRAWSEQVGQSQGFKDFISYVQENGPTIMQLIGNIVKALVAFGTAMAPIASKLLDFITNLAGFIAKLFEAHPAVAQIIGVIGILGGVFWALMAPIAAVSSVLSNVFSMTLLNVVKRILDLTRITGVVSKAFGLLTGAFTSISWPILAVVAVIGVFIGILVYLWKTNENFRKTITEAWNGIKTAVSGAIQGVVDWLTQLWGKIQSTLQPIMPILQVLGQVFMQVLGVLVIGIITNVMNIIQGLWTLITIAFQAIGTVISVAVQIIVGL
ncbi:terminase, partial [Staphylococcus aureus]|nr:terminase [Staphylococcus aureus]